MTTIDELFPSRWLKAADLGAEEHVVQIAKVVLEDVDDQPRPVLYFSGKDKGLVCNKTNATQIAKQHGTVIEDWVGKSITLYACEVPFRGEMVWAVRVRGAQPQGGAF